MVADCVPIVVFDSKNWIFWAIHSWWKWTAKNIVWETIRSMQSEFWSNASDIEVIIWPCISQDSYEVDDTVTQHFSNEYYEKNTNWWFQLNLRSVIVDQCQKAWCKEDNLYHIDIDSFTNPDLFFSARRDGYKTGRFIMWIYKK
jgi:copper oxidase (laccase) domain-containing protein